MKCKPFFRQLYPLQLLIILFSLVIVTWHVSHSIRSFQLQQTAQDLEARARLIQQQVNAKVASGNLVQLREYISQAGNASATRITVVEANGTVLADSLEEPELMDNHADRPEIIAAMLGEPSPALRYSSTLEENMMYVAIPLSDHRGVLRTSMPVTAIDLALRAIYRRIALVVGLVFLIAMLGTWLTARRLSRPLALIQEGAERFATGDFSHKLPLQGSEEFKNIAASLNQMATQLNDRLQAIIRQRNELSAVFASMVEGVFVFDKSERFLSINAAGGRILGEKSRDIVGRSLIEVVRNSDLLEFVRKTLASATTLEGEIVVEHTQAQQIFQAHGTPLKDGAGGSIGGLVVVNDITKLRRLEKVRRDFVANVSHELRTPITSIKGFVETLLDGALDDPLHAKEFLGIIRNQTNRLIALIDDLLMLSRIEQEAEKFEIERSRQSVCEPINGAIVACSQKAADKGIKIMQRVAPDLYAELNGPLFEQAMINLLTNAIKYSPGNSRVELKVQSDNGQLTITVADQGPGIGQEHLPRIFERFYRAEASRSNKIEGTGLGLAIVKYIVQAHNGTIAVDSRPGKGTVFTIRLPRA